MKKAAVAVALMTLSACGGGGGGGTPTGPTKTPGNVVIGPSTAGMIKIGDEQTYTATVNWSDGSQTTETATWTSDNSSVATIDGTGKAHGVGSGEASLVGSTSHGTGVLKIRVVPNYQGTWTGDYTIRGCSATGAYDPREWCAGNDGFTTGAILPIVMAFTQSADKVTGTLKLGSVTTNVDATTSIGIDGGLHLTSQGTFTGDDGSSNTITVNPASFRANGPSMVGSFTWTWTSPGYSGSAVISSDLNSVPRTASLMGFEAMPRHFSNTLDLMRATRKP